MGLLSKIYTSINNAILFNSETDHASVNEQKEFLATFPEPNNEIERSFYKYRCLQFYYYSVRQRLLLNTISFFAILPFILFYRIKGIRFDNRLSNYHPKDILLRKVTSRIPIDDIFPNKLVAQYSDVSDYSSVPYSSLYITKDAFSIFLRIVTLYPIKFHYHLVILLRLSQGSYLLNEYSPKCITTYVCEREFADPVLTAYFEAHQVEYHGFMHGDYVYSLIHAFMHYSKYWLWAKHYVELFESLRCKFKSEIFTPGKYSGIVKPRAREEDYDYYATYYFSNETRDSIEIVRNALLKLQRRGQKCKVRPHPRFSDLNLIKELFQGEILIEDTSKTTIEESLECSYLTIAFASTVLSQAYYSGKIIVIDNISNPKRFNQLREMKYILIDKANMLFSEVVA